MKGAALALSWRSKADHLRLIYRTPAGVPLAAEAAASAFETCAEELEQFIAATTLTPIEKI